MGIRRCMLCGSWSDVVRTVHAKDCPAAQSPASRVASAFTEGRTKVASFPPFSKNGPPPPPSGSPEKRNIPEDHPFDSRALKPMAQALWASSVSLGHALTAYRHVNRLKSTTVSPDGMVGGRGYIMSVKDLRQRLYEACEALSAITDTLHDEIQAPHWKPKLAQLDETDKQQVERFVEESQGILADPEDDAEEDMEAVEKGEKPPKDEDPKASKLPGGGPIEESEAQPVKPTMKESRSKTANSSLPVDSLPGPRVDHLDRGEQMGPWGSYNTEEDAPSNDLYDHRPDNYTYKSEWENDFREACGVEGESAVPDSTTDDTPTQAWDFGIGYGAKGQGAGGYENPSGEGSGTQGVWGPHSGLPGSPGTSVNDTTPMVDVSLNERRAFFSTLLPGDTDEPVARSDYFPGPKGNLVQSESELPQEVTPFTENVPSMVDTMYVTEDAETPYVRYDYNTHTNRPDPLHNWPSEG